MKAIFIRALETADKSGLLRRAVRASKHDLPKQRYELDIRELASVPGTPFAYWVSDAVRLLFARLQPLESSGRVARRGVNTNDDFRFLRLSWECSGDHWRIHVKGGVWSPFYADPYMLVNWRGQGEELVAERVTDRAYKFAIVASKDLYFRPGVTWPRRTKADLSPRLMPADAIFGDKGPAAIVHGDRSRDLLALCAIMNSSTFSYLVEVQLAAADAKPGGAAHSYEVGVIGRTPYPRGSEQQAEQLAELVRDTWNARRDLDSCNETSHVFDLPALVAAQGESIRARAEHVRLQRESTAARLTEISDRVDALVATMYGLDDADRAAVSEGFGPYTHEIASSESSSSDDEGEEEPDDASSGGESSVVEDLVSWLVGVAVGRFDVRRAVRTREPPRALEPFAPLPRSSPAMLVNDGRRLGALPEDYPVRVPNDGILVDDPGHALDLATALSAAFYSAFGDPADALWEEMCVLLDRNHRDIRSWLAREFFEIHKARYSRSRRKAPIYWQLATPSARYSVWLYAHRIGKHTLVVVRDDFLAPKLAHERSKLEKLVARSAARSEIADQEGLVDELAAMLDEVKIVAPLFYPELDDGVVIAMAPLHRLVPQNKAWQRELAGHWDALRNAEYDWAHLAMYLWPERVVPKCAADRSLAIAHGLEDVFWIEENGKWKARSSPTRPVEELVAERTSAAVKAALDALLAAPPLAGGSSKRGRKKKGG